MTKATRLISPAAPKIRYSLPILRQRQRSGASGVASGFDLTSAGFWRKWVTISAIAAQRAKDEAPSAQPALTSLR